MLSLSRELSRARPSDVGFTAFHEFAGELPCMDLGQVAPVPVFAVGVEREQQAKEDPGQAQHANTLVAGLDRIAMYRLQCGTERAHCQLNSSSGSFRRPRRSPMKSLM